MGWRPSMTIMMPDPIRRPLRRVRIILVSLVADLEMSRSEVRLKAQISARQLTKLGKNKNISSYVLLRVRTALAWNGDEIMDIKDTKEENGYVVSKEKL